MAFGPVSTTCNAGEGEAAGELAERREEEAEEGEEVGGGWVRLTWLQTGLYLSPGLFRILSRCLRLKLDTPMDLVSPKSLHFSMA